MEGTRCASGRRSGVTMRRAVEVVKDSFGRGKIWWHIPFEAEDVETVAVTHKHWNFRREKLERFAGYA